MIKIKLLIIFWKLLFYIYLLDIVEHKLINNN